VEVAGGGHGGGVRSVTTAAVPAPFDWRWKKPAGPKTPSGPMQRPRPVGLIKEKKSKGF
jgi:hypothetical protein